MKTVFVQIFSDYLYKFWVSVQLLSWPTYGKMRTVKVAAHDTAVFHNKAWDNICMQMVDNRKLF